MLDLIIKKMFSVLIKMFESAESNLLFFPKLCERNELSKSKITYNYILMLQLDCSL